MDVDPSKTRVLGPDHSIEVGISSWSQTERAIRCRYDNNGRFSPHGSSELPLPDLQPLMEVAADNDLLKPSECAAIIHALAASIQRQTI